MRSLSPKMGAREAVARSIAFAIDQPHDVDVNEIIVRPTASSN
jgi:NADP-dependent 3-hydroxy acid dehydrogenase YdfG